MAFKFIDLFSGIGGLRIPFDDLGGTCVFSSEIDKFACMTYQENFGEKPYGDITKIKAEEIPKHDVLLAGFPCQPFSNAGVSKNKSLGRNHGFEYDTKGTLFFDVARVISHHLPKAFVLENVKNIVGHDSGKTFRIIKSTLEELGYSVSWKNIDAIDFVPQHRERIFIVGVKSKEAFEFPESVGPRPILRSILSKNSTVDPKYTISDNLWKYLQDYREKHRKKGNGFGFKKVWPKDTSRTLSARYGKDGSECLIGQKGKNPRKLTPLECSRLMGFPTGFKVPVSDTQAWKQFGNAVVPLVVASFAKELMTHSGVIG
jgi:DNA (cytosine-5)-methyltransferase 1